LKDACILVCILAFNSIHKRLNMPLSTVWRRVNDLKEMGLIDNSMRLAFKGEPVLSTTYFSSD
jgi:predicted transcriptional regulator